MAAATAAENGPESAISVSQVAQKMDFLKNVVLENEIRNFDNEMK